LTGYISFVPVRFSYSELHIRCWETIMTEQGRHSKSGNGRRQTRSRTSIWGWLTRTDNQKTLRFLGAAIAASVGILVTMGIIHKAPEASPAPAASTTAPTAAASPHEPTNVFNASATDGGNAINNQGGGTVIIQGSETAGHRK
jgi:hypothetical protein